MIPPRMWAFPELDADTRMSLAVSGFFAYLGAALVLTAAALFTIGAG